MFLTIKLCTYAKLKIDLALNNLQRLICHKTQQTKPNLIYSSIWSTIFLPQAQFETEFINFPVRTTRRVKILHTYSLISHTLFPKYPLQHNDLVSYQTPKILDPILRGPHKTLVWPLTSTSNFSTPLLG